MIPLLREHDDAVIAALEALGVVVGDAEAPENAEDLIDSGQGYVVVYPISGGRLSGTLGNPDRDAELVYQVTCVGASREQARWLADKTLELLQTTLAVPNRHVPRVALDMAGGFGGRSGGTGVERDERRTPPVFWTAPRFRVFSTPA